MEQNYHQTMPTIAYYYDEKGVKQTVQLKEGSYLCPSWGNSGIHCGWFGCGCKCDCNRENIDGEHGELIPKVQTVHLKPYEVYCPKEKHGIDQFNPVPCPCVAELLS
jgi:hypothetical protein